MNSSAPEGMEASFSSTSITTGGLVDSKETASSLAITALTPTMGGGGVGSQFGTRVSTPLSLLLFALLLEPLLPLSELHRTKEMTWSTIQPTLMTRWKSSEILGLGLRSYVRLSRTFILLKHEIWSFRNKTPCQPEHKICPRTRKRESLQRQKASLLLF